MNDESRTSTDGTAPVTAERFATDAAARSADAIEAAAAADLYAAAPVNLGLGSSEVGGATALMAPRIPVAFFNRAIGLGGARPATPADLDALVAAYRDAGVSELWIHVGPHAQPPALTRWLDERGFTLAERRAWAKFLRGPEPAPRPTTSLTVRRAEPRDADAVAATTLTAFGMPPFLGTWFGAVVERPGWQTFVAETDGKIVATGSVFCRGDTAWLGIGATLPEFRGRGAQSALLAARIDAAAAAGCTVLATETGEAIGTEKNPSLANIRRAGFVRVCSRLNYVAKT